MTSLSERVKRATEYDDRFDSECGDGTGEHYLQHSRIRPLIEALAGCADVLKYATGPTRDVKTPKMILALTRLEAVLAEMDKK